MSFESPETQEEWAANTTHDIEAEYSTPKACVLCGTSPQMIGLHCSACWNDLADEAWEEGPQP